MATVKRNEERSEGSGSPRLRNLWRWVTIAGLLAFSAFAWWYSSRATATVIPRGRVESLAVEDRAAHVVPNCVPDSAGNSKAWILFAHRCAAMPGLRGDD